jgi:hypothetical protein
MATSISTSPGSLGMEPVPIFVRTMYCIALLLAACVFGLIYFSDAVLAAGQPVWPYFDVLNWPIIRSASLVPNLPWTA